VPIILMKWNSFRKKMRNRVFTLAQAQAVAFDTNPAVLRLQLHQWVKSGELIAIKRGVYAFPEGPIDKVDLARVLYAPAYISLEYALNAYGLLPDVPFAMTLVTPKATRTFHTPFGLFTYQKIKQDAFFGFNPVTLMGELEKCLVDLLYLNSHKFEPNARFWEEMRFGHLSDVDFKKAHSFASKYKSKKTLTLLESIENYARTQSTA
jgi:predicted transcriptional regulator of viral defense system